MDKDIKLSKLHEQLCLIAEDGKIDEQYILSRSQILNPQNAYEHLSAILFKAFLLSKQIREYNHIFIYDGTDEYSIERHKHRLDKYNKGLAFSKPKVFQDALYHSIMVNLHILVDMIRAFCIKYNTQYKFNINEEWLVGKSNEGKAIFNQYCYSNYKLSRKLRNNFYAHETLEDIKENDDMLYAYNKLVDTINELCNYDKKAYELAVSKSENKIAWNNIFFDNKV